MSAREVNFTFSARHRKPTHIYANLVLSAMAVSVLWRPFPFAILQAFIKGRKKFCKDRK